MRTRINYLDALKGFAIILVVLGHVIDGYLGENLINVFSINLETIKIIKGIIYSIHMPLFFIISGYIFHLAFFKDGILNKEKLKGQLLNIFVVFTIYSIILWISKFFLSSYTYNHEGIRDLLLMYIHPLRHYWYIHHLFIYYIIAVFVNRKLNVQNNNNNKINIFIILFLSLLITLLSKRNYLLYYWLYFELGVILSILKINIKKAIIIISMSLIGIVLIITGLYNTETMLNERIIFSTFIGLSSSLAIFYTFKNMNNYFSKTRILNYLGIHSFEIYLIHNYFTVANRIILLKLGIQNFYINMILNILLSILICIILILITQKLKIHSLVFNTGKYIVSKKIKEDY